MVLLTCRKLIHREKFRLTSACANCRYIKRHFHHSMAQMKRDIYSLQKRESVVITLGKKSLQTQILVVLRVAYNADPRSYREICAVRSLSLNTCRKNNGQTA